LGDFSVTIPRLIQGPTYYVRAYVTNSKGTAYSPAVNSFKICPSSFDVIHIAGLNGSPETKTVTYSSISSNISGDARCWLTQNLGADQQPTSATDATVASAGWYWQFNRAQGYKHDGTTLTPSNAWTAWTTSIDESAIWAATVDPCNLLLGLGWRLPTATEWINADAPPQNWGNSTNAYNSVLKLHMAGSLTSAGGALSNRGSAGYYWSNSQYYTNTGYALAISGTASSVGIGSVKATAFSVRCIRDAVIITTPIISNVTFPTSEMTMTNAAGSATVASDGGATVTERGLCWNTTGAPTSADNKIVNSNGVGSYTSILSGLGESATYYVLAYAINAKGTSYSPAVTSFKICPTTFSVNHTAGINGAPETKAVAYHSISSNISGAARCWLTQNLGADQQPSSATNVTQASAGWYWQFNRAQGYKHDGSTRIPSTAWTTNIDENANWAVSSDPCNLLLGFGWRLPTATEWINAEAAPQYWATATDAFNSVLNLYMAGYLVYNTGVLSSRGTAGYYWSNSQYYTNTGYALAISGTASSVGTGSVKATAFSVRCIRN